MKNKIKQFGFSLVELSVVLTIVGITMGSALTLATKKTESDKIEETNTKMDIIEDALETFLITYQRLPCPAQGDDRQGETTYMTAGVASTGGCTLASFNSGNVYAGVIPLRNSTANGENINLPIDLRFDGWGRRFTYAVDFRFANNSATNGACDSDVGDVCFKFISNGSITVNDSSGNPLTTTAVYVLISHGKNGRGAWYGDYASVDAIQLPDSTDSDELENGGETTFDTTFVQKDETATFDDIVRYKTKSQLVVDAGGITDEGLCTAALYQVDNPGDAAATCTGIADETNCRAIAAKVSDLCLDGT